jgi:tryptophan 2,3-dioxygenase
MSNTKYATTHYHRYLQLDKILEAQQPRSAEAGKPAHDEMLFIVIHQAYELWFKQIIHELQSIVAIMQQEYVDEKSLNIVVARLNRIIEIMELLIQQIRVLETMSPLEFLDFRDYLFPASGFQSFQFRLVETLLGLKSTQRVTYNGQPYHLALEPKQQQQILDIENGQSLLQIIEGWLERIPFLEYKRFNFLKHYKAAVDKMIEREQAAIKETPYLNEAEKTMRLQMLGNSSTYFQNVLDAQKHEEAVKNGVLKLSYKATLGALFITLYNNEPILANPYLLLTKLSDLDELITTWRYRHAQMVLRMLGKKIGTGGSSGHDYLKTTAQHHGIFSDLHNISTLLVPRADIPDLPLFLKKELNFFMVSQKI